MKKNSKMNRGKSRKTLRKGRRVLRENIKKTIFSNRANKRTKLSRPKRKITQKKDIFRHN
jgi:hypothetical protein